MKTGFIGLGNMAGAMIGGLIKSGTEAADICGSDVSGAMAKKRAEEFGIRTFTDNAETIKNADYLVMAVKPQYAGAVIQGIKDMVRDDQVIISIIAGKSLSWYKEQFGKEMKVVRCMPNTAALVGAAITGVTPGSLVTEEELDNALEIIRSFGKASVVPESLMDAVCGVSGSAPAYVFMFIEAMADAAVEEGMPRAQAYEFAANAVYGSAKLMIETGKHPGELKDMVCSPAGTTIAAVRVLEEAGFRGAVIDAVEAATERSKEL
ncbi:MAG: pyrroline-5-carboxylate reductase [Lachnospiraceae bacterium]|nr:pyrroline-5-carboxylate reductase [Lachnospiraceae bacterium]MCR4937786.1 pyrroline-5-carboxylate reductase [Lachnospiraceae bacterium]